MLITGVTPNQFADVVEYVSGAYYGYNVTAKDAPADLNGKRRPRIRASLGVSSARAELTGGEKGACAPGARRSHSGSRLAAACWHAYRDVLAELFVRYPDAVVRTAVAKYDGDDDFREKFPRTGETNIGSQFAPMRYSSACDC